MQKMKATVLVSPPGSFDDINPARTTDPVQRTSRFPAASIAPSSRWNLREEAQPPAWLEPAGDIPDEEVTDSYDALTNIDLAGNDMRKVKVLILCLKWGGGGIHSKSMSTCVWLCRRHGIGGAQW
jgi:hypothetical protein